jgi:hypothetical protein
MMDEYDLTVQVENPVDFESLKHHKCDLSNYLLYQQLNGYFGMLNGSMYENLVKYLWVRAEIYDKHAAKLDEDEKVLIDPSLEGKTRAEMGLKEFTKTKIRSNIMGILLYPNFGPKNTSSILLFLHFELSLINYIFLCILFQYYLQNS